MRTTHDRVRRTTTHESRAILSGAIVRSESPEEREYARYLDEIEVRKRRVADLQADLQLLKDNLGRFNAEYHAQVGTLFVELDKIQLAIDEYECRIAMLQCDPVTPPEDLEREVRNQFSKKHEEVHEDEEETRRYEHTYREDQQHPKLDTRSEATLKSVFRELAKRFHPDLARTAAERQQREVIMKRVSAAFHARDIDALEAIRAETVFEDPSFESRSIGEKLVWAIREVNRLDEFISSITAEREALVASDLAQLWKRQEDGENVIERLEEDLRRDIDQARQRLDRVVNCFHQTKAKVRHG